MTVAYPQNIRMLGENSADNVATSELVAANADGSVVERLEELRTVMTQPGTNFALSINVTSSTIPNNTQTSGSFTGAVSGGSILIEDIVMDTDGTGVAGPTNVNITSDNASGLTGASAPFVAQAVSGLGANKTISAKAEATTKHLPYLLESGKKLYISGSSAGGSGAGVLRLTLLCRRVAAGASVAAGGIGS